MRLLLDACVWSGALAALRESGHDAVWAANGLTIRVMTRSWPKRIARGGSFSRSIRTSANSRLCSDGPTPESSGWWGLPHEVRALSASSCFSASETNYRLVRSSRRIRRRFACALQTRRSFARAIVDLSADRPSRYREHAHGSHPNRARDARETHALHRRLGEASRSQRALPEGEGWLGGLDTFRTLLAAPTPDILEVLAAVPALRSA